MEVVMILTTVVLGILGLMMQYFNVNRFLDFFHLLIASSIGLILLSSLDEGSGSVVFALIGICAANFVLSRLSMLRKPAVRFIVPMVSFAVFTVIFQNQSIILRDGQYMLVNVFLVGAMIITCLAFEIAVLKYKLFERLFLGVGIENTISSILILLLGVGILLATIASSLLGLYIVAIAFVSASYYRDDKASNFFVSIAILSVLPALLHSAPNEVVSLTDGDVLSGLFIGLFGVFLIQKLWNSKKRNYTTIGLVYLLFLGLSFFILWLGTLYFKLGGIDAAIAIFVGMSLANAIVGRGFVTASIFMILLGGVLVIPDFLVNEEQLMFERQNKIIDTVNLDDSNSVRSNRLSLNDLKGRHSLISKSSSVQFFLGNQGQTKGAFKKIKGSISIDENMEKSSLEIILPMSEFTTFVSMRDASLRGDDYFRVDQFPNMKYEAVGFNEVDSNLFEVTGNFTMLGITKELIVTLQRIKAEGNHVIVGSGKIDRTLFGMTPNASEGNIVTFNYRAEF